MIRFNHPLKAWQILSSHTGNWITVSSAQARDYAEHGWQIVVEWTVALAS
jgi:hypothetical protein